MLRAELVLIPGPPGTRGAGWRSTCLSGLLFWDGREKHHGLPWWGWSWSWKQVPVTAGGSWMHFVMWKQAAPRALLLWNLLLPWLLASHTNLDKPPPSMPQCPP